MSEQPGTPAATPGRLRLTGYAGLHLLLAGPSLVLFVAAALGGVLVVAGVGIGILLVAIPATRWIADAHRSIAGRVLGSPLPPAYRTSPTPDLPTRLRTWALDPMTWRDYAWILVSTTLGFALSLLSVLLLVVVVGWALWWFGIEPIMRARCSLDRFFLAYGRTEKLEQRVQVLTATRAESIDHSAAELRRIERDLHDGAQARLVALGMNLGMAEDLFDSDPGAARRMVAEARSSTRSALGELRSVVRGIHPPVLADRGLAGAVEALAVDMAIPVDVQADLAGRLPAPVESAVYFAVAECLANVGKHARARHSWIELAHTDGVLRVVVGDDGVGGADPSAGTGMRGVMRRLSAFDGKMAVSSPRRGPTILTLELPCALSSPKTTPSCEKA